MPTTKRRAASFEKDLEALSPRARALALWSLQFLAPPREPGLAGWVEENIVLPPEQNVRYTETTENWPYMVEPLNAIGDTASEVVAFQKSARLGFTKGLVFAAAAKAVVDPCAIIILMPTDEDAIGIAVDDLEPIFANSPKLVGVIRERKNNGRSTILRKQLTGGGSIKVLSGRAPRKLRRHDCRVLLIDEADAFEVTKEGDAIAIAKRRTMAQSPRKIVIGGTPTEEGASVVEREFSEGTQEIFEVRCHECKEFHEIVWEDIEWDNDTPDLTDAQRGATAHYRCPHCKTMIHERHKPWMVANHRWRPLAPEVRGRRSFRINALVSLLPNASWAKLVDEYLKAKRGGPALMQPFVNLVLGKPYRTSNKRVDAQILAGRVEPFGLASPHRPETVIPEAVILITMGVDVQPDRLEATLLGWCIGRAAPLVLGRVVIDGNTLEPNGPVWNQFDKLTLQTFQHPNGWQIGIDGTAIDSGGKAGTTEIVYNWCYPRLSRRVYAIKGVPGKRKLWEKSRKVKGEMRAFNIATDIAKPEVMNALANEPFNEHNVEDLNAMRYSDQLDDDWFEQATNEVRKIKYKGLRAEFVFEPKFKGAPVEALDCLVYGWAVRRSVGVMSIDLAERAARRPPEPLPPGATPPAPEPTGGDWGSKFAEL